PRWTRNWRIWRPRRRADGRCEAFDGRGSAPRLTQTITWTRSYMNRRFKTRVNRDAPLESFAAELTLAAYRVALRTRTGGTWLELQLDLWRAMADTVETWGRKWPRCR